MFNFLLFCTEVLSINKEHVLLLSNVNLLAGEGAGDATADCREKRRKCTTLTENFLTFIMQCESINTQFS